MKLKLFYFQLALLISIAFPAESQQIQFRHLSIDDGLSQNAVPTILQDKQGFMWFGTKDGLNRYDGYTFRIFQNDPLDTTTISSNYISAIFEDSRGVIWIGTLDGDLNLYHSEDETFTRIREIDNNAKITAITGDKSGNLWIGTDGNGLFKIFTNRKAASVKMEHFIYSKNPGDLTSNYISALFFDSKGILWIGTSEGLEKFDDHRFAFKHFKIITKSPEAPTFPADNSVTAIAQFKNNHLWLGTPSGLVDYDIDTGNYRLFPHHYNIFRFGWGRIIQIISDLNGKLWLASPGELMIFDPVKNSYQYFKNDPLNPNSMSYNAVSSICRDRSDIIWIGTPGAGINIYDPKASRFSVLTRKTDYNSRITGFSVRAICEDENGFIWISTDILYRWDRKTGELKSYETSSSRPDDFGNTGAWSIIKDSKGILWFATSQGLFSYNPVTARSTQYKYEPLKTSGLPQKEVYSVFEDNEGNIWISTENYFSKLTDPKNGRFLSYRYDDEPSQNTIVHPSIYQDKENVFWIGTDRGLLSFDQLSGAWYKYRKDEDNPHSLDNNSIKSICPDPRNPDKYIWIGTAGGGLNKFNKVEKSFSYFTTKNGLPNNVIYGILPDSKGNLWLSTNHGLSVFYPDAGKFRNYDVLDGLQSNEFNTGAYYKSKNGEIFFGGIKGLNYFSPENVKSNPFIPNIVITRCEILNQSLETQSPQVKKSIIDKQILTLSHTENYIRFEFAALDFSAPEKNQYAYKLENFHEGWINSGTRHSATFTHLPPGEYIFRVKGSNNDGIWNEKGASLKLIILPPWWQTWWAYFIYGVLFISILYFLRRYELNRINLKNQLRLEKVESDSLRHLDQLKTRFFANISHEFRTPLTLILGQIESVLASGIETKEKGKLHIADRNARRLLTLINQLLDISKIEAGSMDLKAEQHNLVSFLKSLFFSFESLAQTKKIRLKFESEHENIPVVFEPDKMEKVFYNLVSNAFKFTSQGGEIKVNASILNSVLAEIRIKDNGTGIPADKITKIFDRFYQVDNSGTREHEGTGIGLALAKELIELHKGRITASSKEGEGTEFIIQLPLGNLKYTKENPVEAVSEKKSYSEISSDAAESSKYNDYIVNDEAGRGNKNDEIVLIVEDNLDVRNYIREQTETDYIVIEASNGEEGILKAREYIPDLIITDIMMPKLDGYKFSQAIRKDEKTSHIPIIMLTAKAGLDDKIEGLEKGIDAYLTKPFSARELIVRIKNLILQRRELRKKFSRATIIKPSEVSAVTADQQFLQKTIKIIEVHFGDEQFNVEKLADEAGMSVSQINRKLKALIDQPAGQLIRSLRLQRAADLLKQNSGNVAEICYKVGFNDQSYFSRAFKKQFGCSPSEYKKARSS